MVVLVVMGVCGSGKSTVAKALASKIGCAFCDADDWHSESNVEKMQRGIPLTDQDRLPWLQALSKIIQEWVSTAEEQDEEYTRSGKRNSESVHDWVKSGWVKGILACSALRKTYRSILVGSKQGSGQKCVFILLNGTEEVISERLRGRREHFMSPELLQSQFDALELPTQEEGSPAIFINDLSLSVASIVDSILQELHILRASMAATT